MSRVTHMSNGNGAVLPLELIWFRWGGGAMPGKTHVFTGGPYTWMSISKQCVVDDFGTLVPVED